MNWATNVSHLAAMARRFAADERAATAIEYSLIAAGVAGAIIVVVTSLGSNIKTKLWDKIANAM